MISFKQSVMQAVVKICNVSEIRILSDERTKEVADARKMLMVVLHKLYRERTTYKSIGDFVGRDRSTVYTSIQKMQDWIIIYNDYAELYQSITQELDKESIYED